jgi:hypothetical protein
MATLMSRRHRGFMVRQHDSKILLARLLLQRKLPQICQNLLLQKPNNQLKNPVVVYSVLWARSAKTFSMKLITG